ncbi:hypothetical protein [Rhodoligotrophos defluvii]|uniref:hypothetical protein n=1 Tax=Rhodoligotrophos defluvii TaxID=2561934 RepID=UPI0010C9974A|nr:hypothetical protein [Rhodoligotrophos defluvii]
MKSINKTDLDTQADSESEYTPEKAIQIAKDFCKYFKTNPKYSEACGHLLKLPSASQEAGAEPKGAESGTDATDSSWMS